MLTAAALVPAPPLLVPEVAGGSAHLDNDLREASIEVVRALEGSGAERLVVVGSSSVTNIHVGSWDFRPWGVPHPLMPPARRLPLALAVGAWLLDTAGSSLPRVQQGVAPGTDAAGLGRALVSDVPTALLVCGDGSARRDEKAPGHLDLRAEAFDLAVEAAVRAADPAALLALDPLLADAVLADGLIAWQVLAGAAAGHKWKARVPYAADPYGVFYLVAHWTAFGD